MTVPDRAEPLMLSYRLVLPPGWARLPLREDPTSAVEAILDNSFGDLPRDKYGPLRAELRKRLLSQVEVARENQGVDLYLPVASMHGVAIPASFVVALLPFDSAQDQPEHAELLVAYAAQVAQATFVELDEAPAVRSQRIEPGVADAQDGTQFPSTRVDYLVSLREGTDNWLSISFSTVGDGNPESEFTALMVDLFDSIIGTLRWVRGG